MYTNKNEEKRNRRTGVRVSLAAQIPPCDHHSFAFVVVNPEYERVRLAVDEKVKTIFH